MTKKPTLQVGLDSGRSDRFGQWVDSPLDQPTEQDGSTVNIMFLGNLGDELMFTQVVTTGTTERRVSLREDVFALQPSNELRLGALDGQLDLVFWGNC